MKKFTCILLTLMPFFVFASNDTTELTSNNFNVVAKNKANQYENFLANKLQDQDIRLNNLVNVCLETLNNKYANNLVSFKKLPLTNVVVEQDPLIESKYTFNVSIDYNIKYKDGTLSQRESSCDMKAISIKIDEKNVNKTFEFIKFNW